MKLKLCNCALQHLSAITDGLPSYPVTIQDHQETCVMQVHASQLEGIYLTASSNPKGWDFA